MFLDEVELSLSAGRGGAGSASLHREKFNTRGGPDGGDGGRGGDVIAVADPSLSSLQHLHQGRAVRAGAGGAGGAARRHGRDGEHRLLQVPPGTLAWDVASGRLLADLDEPAARAVLARGGRGGWGNVHFASPVHQAPRRRELGEPGVSRTVRLELRLIADVGLVGLPNAGKSTLLAQLTGAEPKIAPYPFTTLSPNLGVAELGGGRTLTLADVPGLIEGAHRGSGLGLTFLRHLARTRVLIHLVDATLGAEGAGQAYRQVEAELAQYSEPLAARPTIVGLNKLDLLTPAAGRRLRATLARALAPEVEVMGIAAATGAGCPELLEAAARLAWAAAPSQDGAGEGEFRLYEGPRGVSREFQVERSGDGYRVVGEALERLVAVADLDDASSVLRLQRRLARMGVEAALVSAGASDGDVVEIGEGSFTFYRDPEPSPGRGPG